MLEETIESGVLLVEHRVSRLAWLPLHHHCLSAQESREGGSGPRRKCSRNTSTPSHCANAQVEEATQRNCGLMEALTLLRESALRSQALPADIPDHSRPSAPRSRAASTPPSPASPAKDNSVKPVSASTGSAATTTHPGNQIGLFKPEVDLVMKVNSLEQQLGRSRDETKLLRRQVNEASQRAQVEEQKNRALKGE